MPKNRKLLVLGHRDLGVGTRAWVTTQFRKFLDKLQGENIFVYSGLSQGVEIACAAEAIERKIPVFGCIPYRDFTSKFSKYDLMLYRSVIPKLYDLKIVEKVSCYEAYRKRTLYLVHQANSMIGFWDKKEQYTAAYFSLILKQWAGKGHEITHCNPETKTVVSSTT